MKIVAISQAYLPDPTGAFLADLARHREALGDSVTVCTGESPEGIGGGGHERRLFVPYRRGSIAARLASQVAFSVFSAAYVARREARGESADVLLLAGSPPWAGFVAAVMPISRRTRVVHWVMDLYPEAMLALWPNARGIAKPIRALGDAAWRRSHDVVVISKRMRQRLVLRVPTARPQTIPLWAPESVVPRADNSARLRRKLGIAENTLVALYLGNLGLAYDFEPILRAAALLRAKQEILFLLVGRGAQLPRIVQQISAARLSNVRWLDRVPADELTDYLALGDVHLLSVRPGWDGVSFPSKLISALAVGRPVAFVGPSETEIAELLLQDSAGACVADAESLADTISGLLVAVQEQELFRLNARRCYERNFQRERALARWDAVLENRADLSAEPDP